jgi:hypothetical protein
MSYSYIKSVFPDYKKSSTKVYDDTVYNSVATLNQKTETEKSTENKTPSPYEELNAFTQSLIGQKNIEEMQLPSNTLEKYSNTTRAADTLKNNQRFYNLPYLPTRHFKPETFQNENEKQEPNCPSLDCSAYMNHVLDCTKCKAMLMKQLNIQNDKARNEEMMEVLSYVVFGVFVLLLIDSLKKE